MIDPNAALRLARRYGVSVAQAEAFLEFAGGNEAAAGCGLAARSRGMPEIQALAVVTAMAGAPYRAGQYWQHHPPLLPSLAGLAAWMGEADALGDGWRVVWRRSRPSDV